ncbi:MAG: hypothetical protein ACK5JS_04550, partial [Mangrovibacterium sp.]
MAVLWLRFLTEIQHGTQHIPTGIGDTQELKEALDILQESRFSEDELEYYDRYWDGVSRERTLINGKTKEAVEKGMAEVLEKGLAEGLEKGLEQGLAEGIEKGREEEKITMVKNLLNAGASLELIMAATGLTEEEVNVIKN